MSDASNRFFRALSLRTGTLNTAARSAKARALLPARCATAASFQCWQTGSRSPTALCGVRRATRAGCSPAGSAPDRHRRPEQHRHPPNCAENLELFNLQAALLQRQLFKRWERHVIHISPKQQTLHLSYQLSSLSTTYAPLTLNPAQTWVLQRCRLRRERTR